MNRYSIQSDDEGQLDSTRTLTEARAKAKKLSTEQQNTLIYIAVDKDTDGYVDVEAWYNGVKK